MFFFFLIHEIFIKITHLGKKINTNVCIITENCIPSYKKGFYYEKSIPNLWQVPPPPPLLWVFFAVHKLSLVVASGGCTSLWCAGFSLQWPLPLRSTGSRHAGSAVMAHGPSCSAACEIFPDQGLNPCPLRGQADSQPLRHQGSLASFTFRNKTTKQHNLIQS